MPIYLLGIGTVIAYNTDSCAARSRASVQITFIEGQTVKAGDLLAQIDPRPYQTQIEQLTANRERDSAQLANAQANLSRYTQLGGEGYATPQLVETQNSQVAQLQAAVKADQALSIRRMSELSYTRLTSPIPGITGVRQIASGSMPFTPPIRTVSSSSRKSSRSRCSSPFRNRNSPNPGADSQGAVEGHCLQPGRQNKAR